ncbi:MAG: molecular chaperone DnaJ [Christensenellaceae bacterium]|nr:molecular chaperone DnaJ [Christensenellaceae bacterium]
MAKADYYETLGINKDATDAEIKGAFRKAAKEYHPDLHPGDKTAEQKFKEINEAYEVLSDEKKRAQYDQFGHAAFDPSASAGGYGGGGFSGFGGFEDIFSAFTGGGFSGFSQQQHTGPARGRDLRYNLSISFEDAAFGVKKEILIPREENCATCGGTGAKPGTQPIKCNACGGSGQVRVQQNTMFGSFATVRTCDACGGSGKIVQEACADCKGRGRVNRSKRIVVNVPAGIDNGQTLNMRGEGEAGLRGGTAGDLYISITVKPHKLFTRRGNDLYLDMNIPMTVAVMGGEIQVPTLNGSVKYTVPEGTQPGTTFRLKEQGVARLNSNSKGDLLVHTDVSIPKRLNDEQRDLVKKLADSLGDKVSDARAARKNIFNKAKQ